MNIEAAAQALVDKLDQVERDESYRCVWALAVARGYTYSGPNYIAELEALRAELDA
jgi:hypothetical protein